MIQKSSNTAEHFWMNWNLALKPGFQGVQSAPCKWKKTSTRKWLWNSQTQNCRRHAVHSGMVFFSGYLDFLMRHFCHTLAECFSLLVLRRLLLLYGCFQSRCPPTTQYVGLCSRIYVLFFCFGKRLRLIHEVVVKEALKGIPEMHSLNNQQRVTQGCTMCVYHDKWQHQENWRIHPGFSYNTMYK